MDTAAVVSTSVTGVSDTAAVATVLEEETLQVNEGTLEITAVEQRVSSVAQEHLETESVTKTMKGSGRSVQESLSATLIPNVGDKSTARTATPASAKSLPTGKNTVGIPSIELDNAVSVEPPPTPAEGMNKHAHIVGSMTTADWQEALPRAFRRRRAWEGWRTFSVREPTLRGVVSPTTRTKATLVSVAPARIP